MLHGRLRDLDIWGFGVSAGAQVHIAAKASPVVLVQ